MKVSPYSSIAFWVSFFFPSLKVLHLQSIINGKSWKHFRLKVRQITWRHLSEWRSWRKKIRTCYLFFRTLTEITLYQNLLPFSREILQWLQKNFRWRKYLVLMAEKFSSYPLPETTKEWIIPLIKQSKPPPLFWVFMFVFQVNIDQYQACQCGWYS